MAKNRKIQLDQERARRTRTECKHEAQDEILNRIASAILVETESHEPDSELIEEIKRQGRRVCQTFGVTEYAPFDL